MHITTNCGVVLLAYNQIQIPASSLVQIVHRRQTSRTTRHQLERAQRLDLFHTTHSLGRMVVDRPCVALELFAVVQGFDFALNRLITDLAIGLA
ncbi:hypothetical protein D3C81_1395060 [compost metagenome]